MSWRLFLAWLTAPMVGIVALSVGMGIAGFLTGEEDALLAWTAVGSQWLFFFGAPAAYGLELLVGLPTYRRLQRAERLRPRYVLPIAAALGLVALPVSWAFLFGTLSLGELLFTAPLGAAGGFIGGAWFWFLGRAVFPTRKRPA